MRKSIDRSDDVMANIERRQAECRREGHDWNVITTKLGSEPTGIICERCGASWSVRTAADRGAVSENEHLKRELASVEQRFENEQVRQMRKTGWCPCCGAPDPSRGR